MINRRAVLALPAAAAAALTVAGAVGTAAGTAAVARPVARLADLSKQSPIDVRRHLIRRRPGLPTLRVHYPASTPVSVRYVRKDDTSPGGCSARGTQETEEIDVEPGVAWVRLDGVRYDLAQFHFHTPSEHTIAGRHAPLEIHLVHADADGRRLVVSVLTFPGRRREVDRLLRRLPEECADPVEVADLDLGRLLPKDPTTLRYRGSLTTDPYTEDVQWLLTVPSTASRRGIAAFRSLFPDGDSRDAQPLHGRHLMSDGPWWAAAQRYL